MIRQYVGLVYKGPNLASTELDIGFGLQPNKYYNKFQDTLLKSFTEHARIQHKIVKSNNYTATISRDLASMLWPLTVAQFLDFSYILKYLKYECTSYPPDAIR